MNTAATLVKREFWEHKGAFLWTPVVIAGVLVALSLITLVTGRFASHILVDGTGMDFAALAHYFDAMTGSEKQAAMQGLLAGIAAPFHIALFFVVVFYALGCLYDERKDRSILFWRSLPVSDGKTVLAKLATALILAPVLVLAVTLVTQLLFLAIATVFAWTQGISAWDNVWGPASPWSFWADLLIAHGVHVLWFAPVVAWFMLVSAYVKKAPLLVAILVPLGLAWAETWFTRDAWLIKRIGERFADGFYNVSIRHHGNAFEANGGPFQHYDAIGLLSQTSLWVGLMIAAAFIFAAIALRRRSGEV